MTKAVLRIAKLRATCNHPEECDWDITIENCWGSIGQDKKYRTAKAAIAAGRRWAKAHNLVITDVEQFTT